ncbi:MAG: hypothetical protein NXI32_26810 [bacterium]|nr:hypothetical protein [bacterium]
MDETRQLEILADNLRDIAKGFRRATDDLELYNLATEAGTLIATAWRLGALEQLDGLAERIEYHNGEHDTDQGLTTYLRCPANLFHDVCGYGIVEIEAGAIARGPRPGLVAQAPQATALLPALNANSQAARSDRRRHYATACEILAANATEPRGLVTLLDLAMVLEQDDQSAAKALRNSWNSGGSKKSIVRELTPDGKVGKHNGYRVRKLVKHFQEIDYLAPDEADYCYRALQETARQRADGTST